VLATGADPRRPDVPGAGLLGAHVLRTWDDARRLREQLDPSRRVVVVGAGFIGLEVAAVARQRGASVTVLEALDTAMTRVVSPTTAAVLVDAHRRRGVDVRFSTGLAAASSDPHGHVRAVTTTAGDELPCDVLVLGVGVSPRIELAVAAGLECADGIVVDDQLVSSDPAISAIGDCAAFPSPNGGGVVRLEAVQNACDQARCVAERLTGAASSYAKVPWFWTEQYDLRLQVAGLVTGHDLTVVRGEPESGSFSVFCFQAGRLRAVESVNRPADHMAARRLLDGPSSITPELVADPSTSLKELASPARKQPARSAPAQLGTSHAG
jgi:3-phenylpropionate/trans-cinnamate dioxygenase ferredoxin reductase subunit